MCYGYRLGEVKLPDIPPPKDGFNMTQPRVTDPNHRPIVQRSIGCHVKGAALPHVDPGHSSTTAAGVKKRLGAKLPKPVPIKLRRLRRFVRRWVRKHLRQLGPECDVSFEAWLSKTHYPEWRKNELRIKWLAMVDIWEHINVKVHCKDEVYEEYKHARLIYSREDEFKCYVGPIFKLIEEIVYENGHFIKHIPVAERGRYIKARLYRNGGIYIATDYTTFEASFVAEIMEAVEFELYSYMVEKLPNGKQWLLVVCTVLMGSNWCEHKHFKFVIPATRMSGEMNTSLGNGFTNLMVFLFLCEENGCAGVDGVVEGDDGLFVVAGKAPTSEQFAELGFNIKIETHLELTHASFCGLVFDIHDEIVVTDPVSTIVQFGWVSRQYARAGRRVIRMLMRCKSLSYAHQYPGCPIIQSLALYGLRMTRSYNVKDFVMKSRMCMWEREQLIAAINDERNLIDKVTEPGIATRLLVESKYGVKVEHQIKIEQYLNSKESISEIDCPYLDLYVKPVWQHYYHSYSLLVNDPGLRSCKGFSKAEKYNDSGLDHPIGIPAPCAA